jgi:hypothetical protein
MEITQNPEGFWVISFVCPLLLFFIKPPFYILVAGNKFIDLAISK